MVPAVGQKHCRSLPTDFFSNLPNNVIDVILLLLPCKDAVRTSILSKKWRYNWCRLTQLTLDASFWDAKRDLPDPTVKFSKTIHDLFSQHEGPITKFTLNITNLKSCPEMDYFLHFLSRNGIQHLNLHFPRNNHLCKVPSSFFSCLWLRHLTLHDCVVLPPSTFKGSFDLLISLKLYRVTTSSVFLTSLISQSPLLELLVLKVVEVSSIIEINAPMLRSLKYKGRFSSICLKNVPLLSKLRMKRVRRYLEEESFNVAKFLESCSSLENLRLEFGCLEFNDTGLDDVPTRLPFALNSVKRFCLPEIILADSHKLSYILCLLRSFPCLEYLKIEFYSEVDAGFEDSLELKHFSNVTFNHLKEVRLECFSGETPEMQFIKLLLAKSPALVKMLIVPYTNNDPDVRLQTLGELSKFVMHPLKQKWSTYHDRWLNCFGDKIE